MKTTLKKFLDQLELKHDYKKYTHEKLKVRGKKVVHTFYLGDHFTDPKAKKIGSWSNGTGLFWS